MTGLVAGNTDGRHGGASEHTVGKADHVGSGIIMVGKLTGNLLNTHICHTVCPQDPLGSLRTGQPPAAENLAVFLEGAFHACAGKQRKQNKGKHQYDIGPIVAVIIKHKNPSGRLLGFHSLVKTVGDGTAEYAVGLAVKGL